jgi:hypothetical protein
MAWKQIGAAALLALSATTALMQESTLVVPFPEVVIYEPDTGALYNVTAEGITSGANMSDVPAFAGQTGYNYMLTPDRSRLLFVVAGMEADNAGVATLYSADVASGACCEAFDPQNPELGSILNAVFSPDGTQVVVSYMNNQLGGIKAGQLVIFDIATKAVVARLDGSRLDVSGVHGMIQPAILISQWTDQGLVVVPSCGGCEPAIGGLAQVWNPVDDTLSPANVPYSLQDQFLGNGESLRSTFDQTFPHNPDAIGMLPVSNVVSYAPAPTSLTSPMPQQVIFFNPDNIYISQAHWVADGLAVLIQQADKAEWFSQSDEAYVLLRDGTKLPLTIPLTRVFLAATSDGWLMSDSQTRGYIYYRLNGAAVEEVVLDAAYPALSYPVVVETPKFGSSVPTGSTFPVVMAP